jgi:AcrR family transcriptional regulator
VIHKSAKILEPVPPARAPRPSGPLPPAKQRQILDGARQVFLEVGFERACMDNIAARADVSKATIYNHFDDKKDLFIACVLEQARGMRERLVALLQSPSGDAEQDLQQYGEALLTYLVSRDALALRRMILAEAARFPELGRALLEHSAFVTRARLSEYLQARARAGALCLDDPHLAAFQFIALCQSDLYLMVEYGAVVDPPPERIREAARGAARTFRPARSGPARCIPKSCATCRARVRFAAWRSSR